MRRLHFRPFIVLLYITVASSSTQPFVNIDNYCVRHYGSIFAELEIVAASPSRNYNGTADCPETWTFPAQQGATLLFCPPGRYSKAQISQGAVLDVTLQLPTSRRPIVGVDLENILITNGSVPGPFPNDATPAVLKPLSSVDFLWTFNGTSKALFKDPASGPINSVDTLGAAFECVAIDPEDRQFQYCGVSDINYEEGLQDCWAGQWFKWNMSSHVDFAIYFSGSSSSVQITAREEYIYPDGQGSGSFSTAIINYIGRSEFPSVVDYDFWENSLYNYEDELARRNPNIRIVNDEGGMPLLINETDSGEWFATANGTFGESVATMKLLKYRALVMSIGLTVICTLW